jgi:hypothetical protein
MGSGELQRSKYYVVGMSNLGILAALADRDDFHAKTRIMAAVRRITRCTGRAWQSASAVGSRSGAWAASRKL